MPDGIRQFDVEKDHALKPNVARKFRDERAPEQWSKPKDGIGWWKDGRVVYWSQGLYDAFKASLSAPDSIPEQVTKDSDLPPYAPVSHGTIPMKIIKDAVNKHFVYGAHEGISVPVRVRHHAKQKIMRKTVNVRVGEDADGNKTFTHAP